MGPDCQTPTTDTLVARPSETSDNGFGLLARTHARRHGTSITNVSKCTRPQCRAIGLPEARASHAPRLQRKTAAGHSPHKGRRGSKCSVSTMRGSSQGSDTTAVLLFPSSSPSGKDECLGERSILLLLRCLQKRPYKVQGTRPTI